MRHATKEPIKTWHMQLRNQSEQDKRTSGPHGKITWLEGTMTSQNNKIKDMKTMNKKQIPKPAWRIAIFAVMHCPLLFRNAISY